MKSNVPVLLLVFNRPDITKEVFDSIRKTKPSKLYIAQDGPRNESDVVLIKQVREICVIDRDCDVQYLYRDANLGCRDAVVGGINRFFAHEEFGIILEDDCVMSPLFSDFCAQCDIFYRNNLSIGTISGSNYVRSTRDNKGDYFFASHHPLLWGWATWKNRWQKYQHDVGITTAGQSISKGLYGSAIKRYGNGGYWDSNWYSVLRNNNRLTIVPCVNLVTNIGHIGIHNQRAGSFHDLMCDTFYDPINTFSQKNILLNEKYDRVMENFMFKLYFYTKIEILLKKIGLYALVHRLFLGFISFLRKIGIK